jgi:hypothetical protein
MANFRSRFVNMAGTHWSRRIPSHSDLNKISKGTPPDASLTHCLDVVGKGRRCAARVPAERSAPARGSTTHGCEGKTAPGGLPHQTHLLSEVPRCANQLVLGAYRYKNRRPRPPTRWTDMSRSSCYTLRDSKHPPFRHSSWAHPPDLVAPALK